MATNSQLKVLGDFLKARRSEVPPENIPEQLVSYATHRRVKGLRREEVAQLVAVSPDYYARVEQGRLAPSEQVLQALGRVFSLSAEQRAYAEDLLNRARGYVEPAPGVERTNQRLQLLLEQLNELPAMVLGPRLEVLAWNELASALIIDFSSLPASDRNYAVITFTYPQMRDFYEDWDSVARTCVGLLRREAVSNPDDPQLAALVGRLSIASEEFRRWWAEHRVSDQDFGAKYINHPQLGRVLLNWDAFSYSGSGRQQLILWSADKGSADAEALKELARGVNP
ncbi:helix-turn-helix domain-containing protein [Glutamicibacter sp. PS]|uniref:helix-turn-helix domain-containing protein n=1 Tax=Glutamicibacter sp. PS TaxID=3075634 RepID=UPI00284B6B55|nr:helix-turn-helix domain-containing protein [Glutamicibacter sp. PS]MDR4533084.1 helix-turn-helix domain-containing protein [Glutamicibacter sp. PS]